MALRVKRLKCLPIGVDLGTSSLKMAQLQTSEKSLELLAAESAEIPPECRDDPAERLRFQSRRIHDILKSGGFSGAKAVVSLPAASTFVQQVKIPVALSNHLDEAVKSELHEKLTYPVEDAVIRHCLAGKVHDNGEEKQELFVVAAARSKVDAYLNMANRAGLEVVGIDIEACAVVECFARLFRRGTDESRVLLFVDIGWSSTQIVLAHGRRMIFARNLPIGGRALDQAVAEALDTPIEQASRICRKVLEEQKSTLAEDDLLRLLEGRIAEIAEEITKCVRYHESVFTNQVIDRMIFVGGQAHNTRLCESIAMRLNLPAQIGNPMAGIKWAQQCRRDTGPDSRKPQPSWAVAFGLGLGTALVPR